MAVTARTVDSEGGLRWSPGYQPADTLAPENGRGFRIVESEGLSNFGARG